MDTKLWMNELLSDLESKDKLERAYGVEIPTDAIILACSITTRYFNVLVSHEERGNDHINVEVVLKKKALEIVEKGCVKLRHDLDTKVEEKTLDFDEYSLYCTLIELEELNRDKDHAKNRWIPRVEKEHEDLKDKWAKFVKKWKLIVLSRERFEKRAEVRCMLAQAHHMLVSWLEDSTPSSLGVALQYLGTLVTELMLTIHGEFKQSMCTVTPRVIAEVASPLTGVPASWLLNYSAAPLLGLGPRWAERIFGQEHVPFLISNALTRHRPGPRPIGSFLFLSGSGQGRTEIAKALAKQIFDDKGMLIEFNLSEYSDSESASRLVGVPSSSCYQEGVLTEAVKTRPFTVVLFDNVDRAHSSVIDILIKIISHGRVSNGQGSTVDFTKTLIIMTSNVMEAKIEDWSCKCPETVGEIPMKDWSVPLEKKHWCNYVNLVREARRHFKPELFDKLDDVIFLKLLSTAHQMAVLRLQLREIASSMWTKTGKRLILYPSTAALHHLLYIPKWNMMGGDGQRSQLEANVVPMLFHVLAKNEIDDMSTIYIDSLVGEKELSCRWEKSRYILEDLFMKQFKQSFMELRAVYREEKERVNKIYLLRRSLFKLMNLLDAKAGADLIVEVVRALIETVNDLAVNDIDVYSMPNQYKLAHLNPSIMESKLEQRERPSKRSKSGVQGLQKRLWNQVVGQHQALDVIVEALLKSIDAQHDLPHRPIMSFLFLGITKSREADLVECLTKHLVSDDGMNLLIQIDLSEYSEADSLFRLLNGPLELPAECGHGQHLPLFEAVKMRPHSILLFSEVEKAHISVFSALLSILDHGILSNSEGHAVDFRSTVVIFTSDLGNKKIIAGLVEQEKRGAGLNDSEGQGVNLRKKDSEGHRVILDLGNKAYPKQVVLYPVQGRVCDEAIEQEKRGVRLNYSERETMIVRKKVSGGHKVEFILDMGYKAIPRQVRDEAIKQEKRGFRFELLNRIDEIVFFNPFAGEQLRKVARLPMSCGPHLENRSPLAYNLSFFLLFRSGNYPMVRESLVTAEDTVSFLAQGLINNESSSSMTAK